MREIPDVLQCKHMNTDTFSVRLDHDTKARLQKLAKSTGRSRAFLAAEVIEQYLDIKEWVASWETRKEHRKPKVA